MIYIPHSKLLLCCAQYINIHHNRCRKYVKIWWVGLLGFFCLFGIFFFLCKMCFNSETLSNLHGLFVFQTSADTLLVDILLKLRVSTAAA